MKQGAKTFAANNWQRYLVYGITIGMTLAIFLTGLFKFVPFASQSELAAREAAGSMQAIIANPLYLPHKLLQLLVSELGFTGLLASRSVSVVFAFIATVFFYRTIRTWYTPRVAILSSALFVSSPWLLHYARLATPLIMYALSIALIWVGLRVRSNKPRLITLAVSILIVLCLLYVPGMVWLILAAGIWQRKTILNEFRHLSKGVVAAGIFSTSVILAPLIYAFTQDARLIVRWLGFSTQNFMLGDKLFDLVLTPYHLFIKAPANPEFWLGRLPYINIAITILAGLGVYVLFKSAALDRMRAVGGAFVICALLAAFGTMPLFATMPLILVMVAAGLALLLQQWFTVFPKNPIARSIGVVTVAVLVALCAYYGLYSYFVAWPRNPDTKQTFTTIVE